MKLNRFIITLFVFLFLGTLLIIGNRYKRNIIEKKIIANPRINLIKSEIKTFAPPPSELVIKVPFICQAPFANWSVHEDSCEEAAILMNYAYLQKMDLNPEYADQEILKMRQWQKDHYGREKDLTCMEAARFVHDYYGYKNSKVFNNITIQDVKREIAKDNLVIVPVMTHSLLNPHYGPRNVYHFILIKGYNTEGVITNDAGIKEGENYFYPWEVIFSAIDAQKEITGEGRTMLVINE
ncbi:MAG: C39 family peptidase [Minisyncoccia bacterium]